MKRGRLTPMILLTIILVAGCDNDKRLVQLAQDADERQAAQNHEIARLNQRIADATKELVEADAKARQELVALQRAADSVYVDPALIEYSVRLANATRKPGEVGLRDLARYVTFGASPRASIYLVLAGRALAFIRGRDYTLPQDLTDLALDVLRHRLVLSYEALSDNVTADAVLKRVMAALPVPDAPLRDRPLTR